MPERGAGATMSKRARCATGAGRWQAFVGPKSIFARRPSTLPRRRASRKSGPVLSGFSGEGMSDVDKPGEQAKAAAPTLSPAKLAEKQRLAEALRANLRRRKAQVRARAAAPEGDKG